MEFHQGAIQHGTESVIMIQTRLHRPDHTLVLRGIQDHCAEPQFDPFAHSNLFLRI